MKKAITLFFIGLMVFVFDTKIFNDTIFNIYYKYINNDNVKIISNENLLKENQYHNNINSNYIKETDDLLVKNKNDLYNVYFTAVNRGYDNLTFYCDKNYKTCMDDINKLDEENSSFSYINQLVKVFNSYSTIESTYFNGRVDIKINKKYSDNDIKKINNELNKIIEELHINDYDDVKEKIKVFHDYIVDTNTYDNDKVDNNDNTYHSDTAIGTLFEGKSICSGYTDTMSLFLDKLNILNTRVATKDHVWNALYNNGKWLHIDLTWDDPVTSSNSNIIQYNYFMIDTDELNRIDNEGHNYNKEIYDFIN